MWSLQLEWRRITKIWWDGPYSASARAGQRNASSQSPLRWGSVSKETRYSASRWSRWQCFFLGTEYYFLHWKKTQPSVLSYCAVDDLQLAIQGMWWNIGWTCDEVSWPNSQDHLDFIIWYHTLQRWPNFPRSSSLKLRAQYTKRLFVEIV